MQSENFDKKIKDLLSQPPPGHDNPAWEKMESMLDKHLPQEKKDNRRIFFLLFMFLLVGGGTFMLLQNNSGNKNTIAGNKTSTGKVEKTGTTTKDNIETKKEANRNTETVSTELQKKSTDLPAQQQERISAESKTPVVENGDNLSFTITNKTVTKKNNRNNKTASKNIVITEPSEELIKNPDDVNYKSKAAEELTKTEKNISSQQTQDVAKQPETESPVTDNKIAEQKQETKEGPVVPQAAKANKQKSNKSFANNFFVTVSAGPDFSAVSGKAGEVQFAWGAGIGYQVSKRFSIRTGFYSARKVYSANPEDYHPPYNFWQYYPNLKNIDANCKVYEIPVTIDYTFSKKEKSSWFVSAGVSSLLMKEETYEYYFKPNSSPNYVTYSRTIKNQNKHYFSVLDLSGGYTRVLNNRLSLRAEPYVKIAMSGIGYGKVDLNSGGMLVSAIIKPFAKK